MATSDHIALYSQSRDIHQQKNEASKALKYNDMTSPSPEIPIHHKNYVSFGVDENIIVKQYLDKEEYSQEFTVAML